MAQRTQLLNADSAAEGGVEGPGRWLVARFLPTAPFSLKMSQATSSVGKTLLVPTMYAIKMALVDAGFRLGLTDVQCASVLRDLAPLDVRIAPPGQAVVTHTFVKIRQEPKTADPLRPYGSSIAYREIVHFSGEWRWALDLAQCSDELTQLLVPLLARVCYIGQRGSFVQFMGVERRGALDTTFSQPKAENGFELPPRWHIATLDDFGPDASLEILSSYSSKRAVRGKHRIYTQTIVPLGIVNTGPGFSEYAQN